MATATFSGQYGHNMTLEVLVGTVSQNVSGNSSRVRVWANLKTNGYAGMHGVTAPLTIRINGGGAIENVTVNIGANSSNLIFSREYDISHDADGSKSFTVSLTLDLNTGGYGSATVSQAVTLTTIPRSSSVSVGNGTIGSAVTINITRQSASFKHIVRYAWGSKSGTIAANVDTSTTWTIPNDFANDIPNSTSGTGTIYVDTYSGSTKTGTQSITFTASVPSSFKPTFTGVSLSDGNTAAQSLVPGNTFVQIISNIKVAFNGASGTHGSSITGYRAEIVGKNQSTDVNGGSLGIMNYSGQIIIRASVSDSRGRWSDARDINVTVLEYFAPTLSFGVTRSGSNSSTLTVNRNARIAPLSVNGSQKNTMSLSFKVAPLGSKTYTTDTGSASGTWTTLSSLTNSNANLSGTYAANQSWVVLGILEDRFTRTEFAVNVATESVVFSYDRNGVGVNKIRERGALDVRGDIYANDKPIQQHQLCTHDGRSHTASGDWNNYVNTGFYLGANLSNQPTFAGMHGGKYVRVTKYADSFVLQEAIDFNGVVSCYRVKFNTWQPWKQVVTYNSAPELQQLTQIATTKISAMWGVKLNAVRKGNMVTLSIDRSIYNIGANAEYAKMSETIPAGYRPINEVHMTIIANSGSTIQGQGLVHLASNGEIRLTCNTQGSKVWTGTVTYLTNDAFP